MSKGEIVGRRLRNMVTHALNVVRTLRVKNPKYGDSWKSKGGFSAFFNLDRKWSRVETLAAQYHYDVFAAIQATKDQPDGMLEALKDLCGYGLLVLEDQEKLAAMSIAPEVVVEDYVAARLEDDEVDRTSDTHILGKDMGVGLLQNSQACARHHVLGCSVCQ